MKIQMFAALTTLVLAVTGCDVGNVDAASVDDEPMPASTIPAVEHIQECFILHYVRQGDNWENYLQCENTGGQTCTADYEQKIADSRKAFELCMRQLPAVSKECRDQFEPMSLTHDSDGDGIADGDEIWMSLNPCEKCSFGGNEEDCDANTDWDNDGIPNAKDKVPRCTDTKDPLLVTYCI